ncbi:MAG: hypothetical protein HZA93_20595 [Verrucomicrobia bacterium]|nr:hypothetical protein [Verrucomicrobiota bacterium]
MVPPSSLPPEPTLQAAFCRKFGCTPDQFEQKVFLRSLYPHARLLTFFIGHRAESFALDRALVRYCGRLNSRAAIDAELREFARAPDNARLSRRLLRLRISGRRFRQLTSQIL